MSRFLSSRLSGLEAYTPGEQPRVQNLIKLNTNESPYPPAPGVEKAVLNAAQNLRLYSDLSAKKLNELIAKTLNVSAEQVITSNGSDEILAFAFQAFGEKGVAFPDITYGFYPVWAALYGLDARVIPLDEEYCIRPQDYAGNDRLIVIANPNAPTGRALPLSSIRRMLDANPDQVMIVDEAYVDFGAESAVALLGEYENLLVVRTFSKSRQLAGGRLGFAVGNPELIADLNRIRYSFNPYNVNSLTQAAGTAALENPDYFEDCRKKIMETREWTAAALRALGFRVLPSQANFIFAAPGKMGGKEYLKALREENILVRHFDAPRTRDFVRITIGSQRQMERLIAVTKELME